MAPLWSEGHCFSIIPGAVCLLKGKKTAPGVELFSKQNRFRIWEKGTNVLANLGKIMDIQITATWMPSKYSWKTIHFRKGEILFFPKIYSFLWLLWRHSSDGNQDFPYFPSTLVPFSQIRNHIWFNIWEKGANVLGNKGKLREIVVAMKSISTLEPYQTIYFLKERSLFFQKMYNTQKQLLVYIYTS